MNQYEFEQYLYRHHKSDSTEPTGRVYKNAFGSDEIIVLPRNYWDYVDWLTNVADVDMQEWVVECDKYRDDKTLSENLMEWLYWDECDRHRNNLPTPTLEPPIGFVA